ncbi:hypothetical protein V8C26DRAFT_404297 [Trichoderma gracile]
MTNWGSATMLVLCIIRCSWGWKSPDSHAHAATTSSGRYARISGGIAGIMTPRRVKLITKGYRRRQWVDYSHAPLGKGRVCCLFFFILAKGRFPILGRSPCVRFLGLFQMPSPTLLNRGVRS